MRSARALRRCRPVDAHDRMVGVVQTVLRTMPPEVLRGIRGLARRRGFVFGAAALEIFERGAAAAAEAARAPRRPESPVPPPPPPPPEVVRRPKP